VTSERNEETSVLGAATATGWKRKTA